MSNTRTGVAAFVCLAVMIGPTPAAGLAQPESHPQLARKALGGKLTMKLLYPRSRDVTVIGVIANGKLKTRRICADFREVRFRLLNPRSGRPRFTPSPAYGDRDKTYSGGFLPPRVPGVYRYRAVAPRARRAIGLKRATCKRLVSPVRTVVVPAADPS